MGVNWLTNRFLQKFFRICQSMNELQGLVSRFKLHFSPFITTRVLKATRGDDSRVRSYVSLRHDLEQFFFLFFFFFLTHWLIFGVMTSTPVSLLRSSSTLQSAALAHGGTRCGNYAAQERSNQPAVIFFPPLM